jgi:hypothetical protein
MSKIKKLYIIKNISFQKSKQALYYYYINKYSQKYLTKDNNIKFHYENIF